MSVSSVTDSSAVSTLSSMTSSAASLGKEDFLTLLVAQLENQDPLEPQDNTEFVAQMAQFSALEQQITTNENLEDLISSNTSIQQLSAFNLLGQTVVAEQDSFTLGSEAVALGFDLDQSAELVNLAILDAEDNVVASLDVEDVSSGTTFVSWDGTSTSGASLPQGDYSVVATAVYSDDTSETLTALQKAVVSGIDTSSGTSLETDQGSLNLSQLVTVSTH